MKYRPEIDGLRSVAVLPVILFHAGLGIFSGGYVGVDIFFVISGYLITTIILSQIIAGRFSLLEFYSRRSRRILPALFLVIACTIPLAFLLMLPSQFNDFSQSVAAVTIFASNILFWKESGYFAAAAELKPLLHTWSLAVEEQYYVLFPLLLLGLWRLGARPALMVLGVIFGASLIASQFLSTRAPDAPLLLPDALGLKCPLLLLGLSLLLQAGGTLGQPVPVDPPRRLSEPLGQAPGVRLPHRARPYPSAIPLHLKDCA